uniref:Uncharacterized protein n=1 Tax=viral metagenome TaxID=1070528 RepID=A0A6C0C8J4_9ZZZZ
MNDFNPQNATLFKINGIKYLLHNHILKKMVVFNVLEDCDDNEIIELNWNISPQKVNIVLHIVNSENYKLIIPGDDLSNYLEIIAFMKYLGVSPKIMKKVISHDARLSCYSLCPKV